MRSILAAGAAPLVAVLLVGCVGSAISPAAREPALPENWLQAQAQGELETWPAALRNTTLDALVAEALANNHDLAQQAARVAQTEADARAAGADLWPQLSAGLDASRGRATQGALLVETVSADLTLGWQLDPWGALRDNQRQAWLALAAAEAQLADTRRRLTANVIAAWYDAGTAAQLLAVFQERLDNLQAGQDIVERGYDRGINDARDLYLARNATELQRANVAAQQQVLHDARARLQQLLGRHPGGDDNLLLAATLPDAGTAPAVGVPGALLERRPDLQQAWLDLLAADAARAAAWKQRLPSLTLVASTSDRAGNIGDLFDGGNPAWSLAAGLAQPLFQGGRLLARADRALAGVALAEQRWLGQVQQAAGEVESALANSRNLAERSAAVARAEEHARAAYELGFDQYQRGLVDYTTVLEAQRRAFDAETQRVQLRNQRLQNRIALQLALGGPFS